MVVEIDCDSVNMPGSDDFLAQGSEHAEHLAFRDASEETAAENRRLRQELAEAKEALKRIEIAEGQGLGARPKTSPASRPEVAVKKELGAGTATPEGKGENMNTLAEVLRKVIPRDCKEGTRVMAPLQMSGGISLERWERQIVEECQYRHIDDDRSRIIFALKHTEPGIHAHFDAIDPSLWDWEDFMVVLRNMAPLSKSSSGPEFLPCTMALKRYPTQAWIHFTVSWSYLQFFNELCATKRGEITTWHRMTVLQIMENVAPPAATKKWKNPDMQGWNRKEIDKIVKLSEIPAHVGAWVRAHPHEDDMFRKKIPLSEAEGKSRISDTTVHAISVGKYCSIHGQCHHDTSECYSNPENTKHTPSVAPWQNQRVRGRVRGTPAHVGNLERGRGRDQGRGRGSGRSRGRGRGTSGVICFACGQKGHFASHCERTKTVISSEEFPPKNGEKPTPAPEK